MIRFQKIFFIVYYMTCTLLPAQASVPVVSSNPTIKKVLIVVAMDSEAQPIIKTLQLHQLPHSFSGLPMRGYVGQLGKIELLLMMNGKDPVYKVQNIGTEAATLSTYLGIEYFHPDLIISIGTAGGVIENGSALKDIYLSKQIYFADRRIPMTGYQDYGRGGYKSMSFSRLNKQLKLKSGIVCSEGSFDEEKIDYAMFLQEHCSAVDMEAAGVAWVSMLTKTPMIAIKGITNFVRGKHIHAQYEKNLPSVVQALANKLKLFITLLP